MVNKPPEASIYFPRPLRITDRETVEELDTQDAKYRSRKGDKHLRRRDLGACLNETDSDGFWYFFAICMSNGEASAVRTAINRGDYGRGMRCVYLASDNVNNGRNPNQLIHQMFVRRPEQ